MQIKGNCDNYILWLSSNDTYNWAHRPNMSWPCSTLSDKRLCICVDLNGIYDITVNGRDSITMNIDDNELIAIVSDHLPDKYKHLWPVWN